MKFVPEVIGKTIARNALHIQKASPEALLFAGVAGMVGSTILACRATLKLSEVMDDAHKNLETARTLQHFDYSERDRSRDISLIYFQSGVKIARIYTPAVLLGIASIYAIRSSHNILTERNLALTAAYSALDKGFREYRGRVVDKYGENVDRELRYGTEEVEIEDPETGKKKAVTRVSSRTPSIYARFFDPTCGPWDKNPETNLFFLKCQQDYHNDLLRARGHVFLNEIYDELGMPRSEAGAVVGWWWSEDGSTDNFINFGVFDGREQVARDFVNGREGAILLDFNVDGVIYDKLGN